MELLWYKLPNGEEPARSFVLGLRDLTAQEALLQRLYRLEAGNLGDARHVGRGVLELRVHAGPGYRIYLSRKGADQMLILLIGRKDTQERDIPRAQRWLARHGSES